MNFIQIKKQIELINPKVIICLGTYKYLYLAEVINDSKKKYFIMCGILLIKCLTEKEIININ